MADSDKAEQSMGVKEQEPARYVCTYEDCRKEFKRRDRLLIHVRTHTGERPFVCQEPGCGNSYCRQSDLVRHQQNTHSPYSRRGDTVFLCGEEGCGLAFTLEQNLQRHFKRQHCSSVVFKYKCEVEGCTKTFEKNRQLWQHMLVHANGHRYKCSFPGCGSTFNTPSRLQRHMKMHEGYQCDREGCSLVFNKFTELRKHKSSDHLVDHTCDVCGETFPKRHLLNNHYRNNHGEKGAVPCEYEGCGRVYSHKRNLMAHIKHFHNAERFLCEDPSCGKTFSSKQRLKGHMKLHERQILSSKEPTSETKQAGEAGREEKEMVVNSFDCDEQDFSVSAPAEVMFPSEADDCVPAETVP